MMYAKIKVNTISHAIPLADFEVYNFCPICGKEIPIPNPKWAELITVYGFNAAVYCDRCSKRAEVKKSYILQNIANAVQHMDPDSLQQTFDTVIKNANKS